MSQVVEKIRPLYRTEYDKLVELGAFADERIELLRGRLSEMSPQDAPHWSTLDRVTRLLVQGLGDRAFVRAQAPLALTEDSEPEPDVAVVAPGDYDRQHPTTARLLLEVSESSLAKDRGPKAALYAEAGIEDYWIVNLVDRQVEVHRSPVRGTYTSVTPVGPGETVSPLAFPDVTLPVSDILPRRLE